MGHIKKLYQDCLVGAEGSSTDEVYPVTSTRAVYDENNDSLQTILDSIDDKLEGGFAELPLSVEDSTIRLKLSDISDAGGIIVSIYDESSTSVYLVNCYYNSEAETPWKIIVTQLTKQANSYRIDFSGEIVTPIDQEILPFYILKIVLRSVFHTVSKKISITSLTGKSISLAEIPEDSDIEGVGNINLISYLLTSGGSIDGNVSISGALAIDSIVPNTSGLNSIDFGNHRITNIAPPVQPNDATTKVYVDSVEDSVTEYVDNKLNDYMPKSGDRFSGPVIFEDRTSFEGPLYLDDVQIRSLADPTSPGDAANKQYVDTNLETKQDIIPALSATTSILQTKYLAIPISNNSYSFEIVITRKTSVFPKYTTTKYLYCGKGNDVFTREIICIGDDVVSEWKFGLKAGSGEEYIRLKLTGTGEFSVYVSSFDGNPVTAELVDSFNINPTYPSVSAEVKHVAFQE